MGIAVQRKTLETHLVFYVMTVFSTIFKLFFLQTNAFYLKKKTGFIVLYIAQALSPVRNLFV